MTFHGTPPRQDCGKMSGRTKALRPDIGISEELTEAIRRERKRGQEPAEIAATLALPVEVVERALLAMRMPQPGRTRGTINCTREAHAFIHRERQGLEPIWQVLDRLIGELIERRDARRGKR